MPFKTPSASAGGMTLVAESLTPVSEAVSIVGGLVVGGMFDGYLAFNDSQFSSLTETATECTVVFSQGADSNNRWVIDPDGTDQLAIAYPNKMMGDATVMVEFTGNTSGNAQRHIGAGIFKRGTEDNEGQTTAMMFGYWNTTQGKPTAGCQAAEQNGAIVQSAQENWNIKRQMRLAIVGGVCTFDEKLSTEGTWTTLATKGWDVCGSAFYAGVLLGTRDVSPTTDTVEIYSVTIDGQEYAPIPA